MKWFRMTLVIWSFLDTLRDFVIIIKIPDEKVFSETAIGHTASYFEKLYDVLIGFVTPRSHKRLCNALWAFAERWLLVDIGWFVLLL